MRGEVGLSTGLYDCKEFIYEIQDKGNILYILKRYTEHSILACDEALVKKKNNNKIKSPKISQVI